MLITKITDLNRNELINQHAFTIVNGMSDAERGQFILDIITDRLTESTDEELFEEISCSNEGILEYDE